MRMVEMTITEEEFQKEYAWHKEAYRNGYIDRILPYEQFCLLYRQFCRVLNEWKRNPNNDQLDREVQRYCRKLGY